MFEHYLNIFLTTVFIENIALSVFLGMCTFIAISKKIDATGIPVILLNRSLDNKRFSSVTSNNYLGGKQIANFLIKGGHRKISHIAGNEKASTQRDRETGFIDGLKENGVDLFSREIGNFVLEEASSATRKMFSSIDFPDAIFVAFEIILPESN